MNIKSPSIGIHKRDNYRMPIKTMHCQGIMYLNQFHAWLVDWQKMETKQALSRETFSCAIQTCFAMPKLIDFLLTEKALEYVLPGKISSDPIERRFGQYRQLAGDNYFLSVRQFLEAEKTIRWRSLAKYSNLNLQDVQELELSEQDQDLLHGAESLLSQLPEEDVLLQLDDMSGDEDESIIYYYIAGYIARSVIKRLSCSSCKELVCKKAESPFISVEEGPGDGIGQETRCRLIEQLNRGGLVTPSDLVFLQCLFAKKM